MRDELDLLQNELNSICVQLEILNKKKHALSQIIKSYSDLPLNVASHAIVRYFQRGLGYDIKQICSEIASPEIIDAWEKNDCRDMTIYNEKIKLTNVIKGSNVVTVMDK